MKVYYNGSCNICNTEISHYKKNNDQINFIDISESVDDHIKHLSKKQLFRRMHVYHEGKILSGAESFLILWSKMPNFTWLSKLLSLPLLRQIWYVAYESLAIILFIKNFYLKK